jgi:hypothetical protein
MTWFDPIVDEVRRARDAYAASFNCDLRAIYRDLKAQDRFLCREVHGGRAEQGTSAERAGRNGSDNIPSR